MVSKVTNIWRAVQLIALIEECNRDISELECDTPAWVKAIEIHEQLLKRLLRIICRREPTTDEMESITRADYTEDYNKVARMFTSKMSDSVIDQELDKMIRGWE